MKILITGANSFIGNNIVSKAVTNHNVIGLDLSFRKQYKDEQQIIIKDYKEYPNKITNADVLIHLAWVGTNQEQRISEDVQRNNYEVSLAMADRAFNELGVKRFILAGSQAEYGPHNNELITEDTSITPNTAYGKYKNKLFETLKAKYPNKVIIDARIFSCYGPKQTLNNMVPGILSKMIKNEVCEFTPATQLWNYIYVEDLADIFLRLCEIDTKSIAVNLASDDTRQLKDMIMEMKSVANSNSELKFGAHPYNTSGYVSLNPSIDRLKRLLPDIKFTPFKIGVSNVIKGLKEE